MELFVDSALTSSVLQFLYINGKLEELIKPLAYKGVQSSVSPTWRSIGDKTPFSLGKPELLAISISTPSTILLGSLSAVWIR